MFNENCLTSPTTDEVECIDCIIWWIDEIREQHCREDYDAATAGEAAEVIRALEKFKRLLIRINFLVGTGEVKIKQTEDWHEPIRPELWKTSEEEWQESIKGEEPTYV